MNQLAKWRTTFQNTEERTWHSEDFLLNWLVHKKYKIHILYYNKKKKEVLTQIFCPLMHANFRQSDELMLRKKEWFYLTFFDIILTAWLRVEHSKMLQGPFPLISVALTQFLNIDLSFLSKLLFFIRNKLLIYFSK